MAQPRLDISRTNVYADRRGLTNGPVSPTDHDLTTAIVPQPPLRRAESRQPGVAELPSPGRTASPDPAVTPRRQWRPNAQSQGSRAARGDRAEPQGNDRQERSRCCLRSASEEGR